MQERESLRRGGEGGGGSIREGGPSSSNPRAIGSNNAGSITPSTWNNQFNLNDD